MPVIGVTSKDGTGIMKYVNAIRKFGGEPLVFASRERYIREHRVAIPEYLAQIDGLLLPGGGDINPCLYFQKRHSTIKYVSRSRDALEIWLFQNAMEANIPVFGICRGIQIMSVAMRGNLCQDIPSLLPHALCHTKVRYEDSRHEIGITEGSLLRALVGEPVAVVNSAHHQAVDAVGEELVVTARSTADGIIEAIEHPGKRFMLGVQYHPERMFKKSGMDEHAEKLFEAFIAAAS